jgi:DNA-binding NarL/FixJ family response regulator
MATNVCIVEDNEQLRTTLAKVLNRAEGYCCPSHYGSAEEALAGLPKDKPNVVLMDINLPGMNGVECARRLKQMLQGGSPMTAHIARKVVQSFQKPVQTNEATEDLSPREREVLDCLSQGLIYKEIAEKLGISYETVHTYIRRIYEKLQVRTRTEAVAKFLRR